MPFSSSTSPGEPTPIDETWKPTVLGLGGGDGGGHLGDRARRRPCRKGATWSRWRWTELLAEELSSASADSCSVWTIGPRPVDRRPQRWWRSPRETFKSDRERYGRVLACRESGRPLERVREVCLGLPEVTERLGRGSPAWFIRDKKAFVMCTSTTITATASSRSGAPTGGGCSALVGGEPEHYLVPPYVGLPRLGGRPPQPRARLTRSRGRSRQGVPSPGARRRRRSARGPARGEPRSRLQLARSRMTSWISRSVFTWYSSYGGQWLGHLLPSSGRSSGVASRGRCPVNLSP